MALVKPTYTGVTDIMAAYDSINGNCDYYYSVWHGSKELGIAFQYVGNEALKAREYLKQCLEAREQAGDDGLLYLKFHPADKKGKYIERNTPVIANMPIAVIATEGEVYGESAVAGTRTRENDNGYNIYKMRLLIEELPASIDKKINDALELKLAELDEVEVTPEVDPVEKTMGIIRGIAGSPEIMGFIGQVLNFLKPAVPAVRINGMNEKTNEVPPVSNNDTTAAPGTEAKTEIMPISEEILNEALGRLAQHCRLDTDLLLLADMADNEPATFAMLLGMLRKK